MKEPMEVSQQLLTWEELLLMANLNRTATIETAPESVITWREALLMVYLLGIVFFFLRNVWSLTRMLRLIRVAPLSVRKWYYADNPPKRNRSVQLDEVCSDL